MAMSDDESKNSSFYAHLQRNYPILGEVRCVAQKNTPRVYPETVDEKSVYKTQICSDDDAVKRLQQRCGLTCVLGFWNDVYRCVHSLVLFGIKFTTQKKKTTI